MYIATINTPGYLPWQDDPPEFENTAEAWQYLAEERRFQEDDSYSCSETVELLDRYAAEGHGEDTVYGDTPGYEGTHDLGLAYCVTRVQEEKDGDL